MKAQTLCCLENIEKVLTAVNAEKSHISMLRIYIKQSANTTGVQWEITEALKQFFGDYAPASS